MKIKQYYTAVLLFLLDKLGINALFRFLNRDKFIILWYHGICDDNFKLLKDYDERHIPRSLFRKQLAFLKSKGYVFFTLSEMLEKLAQKQGGRKAVVLTFDDGFSNVVEKGYPIMQEFGAKGCVYLPSGLIGSNELLWTDYIETLVRNSPPGEFKFNFKGKTIVYQLNNQESYETVMKEIKTSLRTIPDKARREHLLQFQGRALAEIPSEFRIAGWEQVKSLDTAILEVGSHTRAHPNCSRLSSEAEFEAELRDSRLEIEKMAGYPVKHFCYPAGAYNDEVVKRVKQYGYQSAVTIIPGLNDEKTDLYQLRRIKVKESFLLFKATISGSFYFVKRLRARLRLVKD